MPNQYWLMDYGPLTSSKHNFLGARLTVGNPIAPFDTEDDADEARKRLLKYTDRILEIEVHPHDHIFPHQERTMQTYSVYRYTDGVRIGTCTVSADQWRHLQAMCQQPKECMAWKRCLIRLRAVPHEYYDLAPEFQDTHKDTTVYFD
jgi:hypothetical protein